MPDSPTPKRGLLRPRLGKKPWKTDWDFNFLKLDTDVGGLIDGTIPAGRALRVFGSAVSAFIYVATGDLGAASIPAGEVQEIFVDHTASVIFDLPAAPAFSPIADVHFVLLGELVSTNDTNYGGTFIVRVENYSASTVLGVSILWRRKGLKFS